MAELFKPTYYVDPKTGKRCKVDTPGAVKRTSKHWWARWRLPNGQRPKVKLYRDKKASETKALELQTRGERIDAGRADALDDHAKRPLSEHAADFRRYLAAKGNTVDYVGKMLYRLTAVLDACRFLKIGDLQSSVVVEYLGRLRRDGKSVKTANDYLAAIKGFSRWLWRDKRSDLDGLAGLSKLANAETDLRHARRDLSPDELARLLDAARASAKTIRYLSGIDRHYLYLTACATGFRASELASMTPESFDLDGDTPTARVQASCTKNRREAVQPLPLDVARSVRDFLHGKPAGFPLWPDNPAAPAESWRRHGAEMIRRDLADARRAWLQSVQDERRRDEMARSDFLGLPRRGRPLRRLPRLAAFVHNDGGQGRRVAPRASRPGPAFDLRPHVPLLAFAVLRPGRRRAVFADPGEPLDARSLGRDGDRWKPVFPWPKPWPTSGDSEHIG